MPPSPVRGSAPQAGQATASLFTFVPQFLHAITAMVTPFASFESCLLDPRLAQGVPGNEDISGRSHPHGDSGSTPADPDRGPTPSIMARRDITA